MRESSTYQAILEEGREAGREEGHVEEARELLREYGTLRFGPPDAPTLAALDTLAATITSEQIARRLVAATSWADLVRPAEPGA